MKKFSLLAALAFSAGLLWILGGPDASIQSPEVNHAPQLAVEKIAAVEGLKLPSLPLSAPKAIQDFRAWSEQFLQAEGSQRGALIEAGKAAAREHTRQIAKMIPRDPQAAIAHAVPMVIRQKLPPEIVGLLEERPNLRGDYEVYGNVPAPGAENSPEPYTRTIRDKNGRQWNAHVYGRRLGQRTTTNISINGISVAREMAVSDSPVRVLEVGELPVLDGKQVVDVCPVSGIETEVEIAAAAPPPPVEEETPAFETPEQIVYVCSGGHISQLAEKYLTDEEKAHWASLGTELNSGTGSGPAHGTVGTVPGGWTTGNRTFLYIRAAFPDNPVDPQNEQECYDMLKQANDFVVTNSYGRCYLTYAVPPLVILPYPLSWYSRYDADEGGGDYLIQTHARQIARSMGYDYMSYNLDGVRWQGGPGSYGGSASVGGRGMRMKTSGAGTFMHELGHNLGVWHANYWRTTPPSVTGPGSNLEYGNNFDVMGSGGISGQFTASFKSALSWMPQEQFWNVTSSGLYRIHQTDEGIADPSLRYALRIRSDAERDYWAEFRQLHTSNSGFMNGLMMTFDRWGLWGIGGSGGAPLNGSNAGAQLLDMTPGSFGNGITDTRNDSALRVGRTYSDPEFNIHVTPVARNTSTTPPSMDVRVQIGDTPGNTAPTLTLNASTTTAAVAASVTLTATATDAEGDTLAYAWFFDDGTYSTNNSATQTKSWSTAGHYRVLCTASDMKGKRTTKGLLITVGSPSSFTVSGTVTQSGGQPLEGVYVANYAPSNNINHSNSATFRGTWTDSDGNYVITRLAAGTYTITPNLYPHTFAGSSTTVGPNVTGKNFSSTLLPAITISYPDGTANESSTPGTAVVRLNRAGSTFAAVSVQIYDVNSGSATRNTDYTLNPAPKAATSPDGGFGTSEYIIPAGAAFLDITVTPVNDGTAEGVEYAALDFVNTAAGYIMGGNPRAVVPIIDDESSLPVVRITPVDDVGQEAGTDKITLKLERNGPTTAALNVNVAYTGTATRNSDYSASTAVTIPAAQSSVTFDITPVNDADIETTETIITTISTNAAYLRDSTAQNVTSILNDDDMPVVTITATDAAASEAGSNIGVFTITRSGLPSTSLTVDYSVNGRAILGTDYRRLDGRAVIPAGSASTSVEIVPFDDTLDEGTQDVVLQLRTAQNYFIGGTGEATVNIADDDITQVYLELNTGTGVEPASGSSNGPVFQIHRPASGAAVTVNYTISGTAVSGTDFTALPGTVTFASGETSKTVTVSMLADTLNEDAETVTLTLQPGTGYSLLPGQKHSMTSWIIDGDQQMVDVSVGDVLSNLTTHLSEADTSTGREFFIARRVQTSSPLVVNYTLSGTATSGVDYTGLSGTATIPADATGVRVKLTPVNDTIPEGVETIVMNITPVSGTYGVRIGTATMLLADNDNFTSGSVAIGTAPLTVAEDVGTVNIPVVITGTPPGAVTVRYRVNSGAAAGNGIDYSLPEGELNFAAGENTKNIVATIIQDILPEPSESFTVLIYNITGANQGAKTTHTINIDNRSMPEAFSDPASSVTSSSMTFNGRILAGGLATTYWFEYGGTTAYGSTTPVQNLAAGNTPITVNAAVSGLTLSSYHFRLVAQNSRGISYGVDQFPGIISTPPVISEHPEDLVVNVGEPASFNVTASGGGLSYQWQKGTTDIPLATASTYSIPATTLGSAGTYRCIVTNSDGEATSNPATLTVVSAPTITGHPTALALDAGQTATFTVSATGLFLEYQWQKDGNNLPGQTSPTLTLASVSTLNSGIYRCVVSNSAGSANSNAVSLSVNGPPSIVQHPQNVAVNLGAPATFTIVAAGPDLSYEWRKAGVKIDGVSAATYTIPATAVQDAASYTCRVTNSLGSIESNAATLTVVSPPVLLSPLQASSVTINEGQTFNANVQVQGLFLSYQWRRDGLIIPGATSPALEIPNLTDAHTGSYTCRIWNAAAEIFSPAVNLLVITPPVILNEPVDVVVPVGQPATVSVAASGPMLSYQWWRNGLPLDGATSDSFTISSMNQASIANYYCKVSNSAGTVTTRSVLIGIEGMPVITQSPYPALVEVGAVMRMEVQAQGEGLSYAWKLNGKPAGTGAVLEVWPYATKNGGTYVAEISNPFRTSATLPVSVATVSDISPALDQPLLKWSTSGPAFWRPSIPAQSKDAKDAMTIGNIPHGYFSRLGTKLTGPLVFKWWQKVSTQAGRDTLRVLMDGVDSMPAASGEQDWQELSFQVPAGVHEIEYLYAKDDSGSAGSDRVWIDMVSTSPAFAPSGSASERLVASGTEVILDANYSGTPSTFQWRRKGAPIKGATGPRLVISSIKLTDAGAYDCVLGGLVNGVAATQLTPAVEIGVVDATGSRQVVPAGGRITLSAVAVGKNLTYQWRRGTTAFLGETNPKISLLLHQSSYSDNYICAVTNAGGTVDAGIHRVFVFEQAPILTQGSTLPDAVLSGSYRHQVLYDLLPARTPTTFVAKGLPKGLTIHKSTGEITGIPEESRSAPYQVFITAANAVDDHTIETSIRIHGLGGKTGVFTAPLVRSAAFNQNLGGRIDLVVTANGSFSGTLTLGTLKHSFKARLEAGVSNLAEASARFDVARGKDPAVRVNLRLTDSGILDGSLTLGLNSLLFSGWQVPWTKAAPATAWVGTGAPIGCYNFSLTMPSGPAIADADSPQGTGFGTFIVARDTGAATITGRLPDDTTYTASSAVGALGQMVVFTPLYAAPGLGSLQGELDIDPAAVPDDNTLDGLISWWRPSFAPAAKQRLDADGFEAPVTLTADGSRYVTPVSPNLVLGLTEVGLNSAVLSFLQGGINASPPVPDISFTLGKGNVVTYPATRARATTLSFNASKGTFAGGFNLEDNDLLDLRPPPAVLRKLSRKVSFQGLLVRGTFGWRGVGSFLLPELPDAVGETLSNTPVHAGTVQIVPDTAD